MAATGTGTIIATSMPVGDLTGVGANVISALGNALNGASGLVGYSGALGTPTSGVASNLTALNGSAVASGTVSGTYMAAVNLAASGNGGVTGTLGAGNGGTGLTSLGTNVATAAGTTLSAAGGLSSTIGSGTATLGTSAIASGACATAVQTAITNTATTDVIWWGFNGDPTAVTGYSPTTNGMLTIIAYPTAGNANFKVCNNTSASVTPGGITLNVRVIR